MSKARIMCILNGQPMLHSSDSNDTDDSGPSLEIISDTEEWGDGSDLELTSREEESVKKAGGSKREKTRVKLIKHKDKGKAKVGKVSKVPKGKIKSEPGHDPNPQKSSDLIKVKKEIEPAEQTKEKDGESLLDLLELEMRARAIRALIRKEEDIIPPVNPSTSEPNGNTNQNPGSKIRQKNRQLSLKVVQDKLQELDTNFNRNLAKATQEISEEEDVVLVLEPTTTIELLSSESEGEGSPGKRRKQKFMNERILEEGEKMEKTVDAVDDKSEKSDPTETEAEKSVQNDDKEGEKVSVEEKTEEEEASKKDKEDIVDFEKKVVPNASEVREGDEDKSTDLEIVIDLDDYPDDMENVETSEIKKKKKKEVESALNIDKQDETAGQTSAETWATRYYQTEDVQSVMKESKIQSEIRKRLRERQRLARLNNSPGLNAALQTLSAAVATTVEKGTGEKEDSPTTGSVEEYLALKNVEAAVLDVGEKTDVVSTVLEKETEELAVKEKEKEKEKENIEDPVVSEVEIKAENIKVVQDIRKAAELVDEENEDGEIVDKIE